MPVAAPAAVAVALELPCDGASGVSAGPPGVASNGNVAYWGCAGGVGAVNGSERNGAGELLTPGEKPRLLSGRASSGCGHVGDGWKLMDPRPCEGRVDAGGYISLLKSGRSSGNLNKSAL